MCGLAGFWCKDGSRADKSIVEAMLDRQRSRGPDDRGTWSNDQVALGLDRLSILDLSSHGHQPIIAAGSGSVLVYNGEVYNWRSLRRELQQQGVEFHSDCDTEVVLHALDRWGPEQALPRFNGMFACAWFDPRQQCLWLARDRAGIKPLYVTETPTAWVFASEAKALFAHPSVRKHPDAHSLVTLAYMGRLAGDWTGFEGVRSVLPGSALRIDRNGATRLTWFDFARDVDVDRILASRQEPFEQQVKTMRRMLEESVELHLQSDAPLAVMCSGGLDSSLTTAIASRHKPELVAFVAEVEDAPVAEADKAQVVADHVGVGLRRIPISVDEYPSLWAQAAWHNDDPIFFYQNPMTLKVSRAVHQEGFKVLVTGEGADELFGGYPWQMRSGAIWDERRWHARLLPDIKPLRWLGRLFRALEPFDLDAAARYPFDYRGSMGKEPPGIELAIDAGIRRRLARDLFQKFSPIPDRGERAFLAHGIDDLYHHLRILLVSNDKMTMANSVEMRVPFLENNLIDFGLHLAAHSKLHRKNRKRIVKAAAEDLLPHDIIHALKVGFPSPPKFWSGYVGVMEGGFVPELFKWTAGDLEYMFQIMNDNVLLGHKLVNMELWGQMHLFDRTPEEMEQRLREARRRFDESQSVSA